MDKGVYFLIGGVMIIFMALAIGAFSISAWEQYTIRVMVEKGANPLEAACAIKH